MATLGSLLTDKPTDIADELINASLTALDLIGTVTANPLVGDAKAIVSAVQAIFAALQAGFQGDVTPDAVLEALAKLPGDIAAQDAKADAALAEKFKTPTP